MLNLALVESKRITVLLYIIIENKWPWRQFVTSYIVLDNNLEILPSEF
jgi:hypothetical protein